MLHVVQNNPRVNSQSINRVVWCPFLPEDDETEEDNSTLLVLTHGNKGNHIFLIFERIFKSNFSFQLNY